MADLPFGSQKTYLVDNTTGDKSTVYSYSGSGWNLFGDIYFSGDSNFAAFPVPQFEEREFNDYYIVNFLTKEIQKSIPT